VFAKDSSHIKLAQAFEAKNIDFGAVAGPDGTSLNASILYGSDPKRRLEVLWQNEAARSDVSLIVITGQSQWSAPKGLRLGLALAALEKLNGKPFKMSGFDKDHVATLSDWDGGTLSALTTKDGDMASSGKKKTTMAKLMRESRLRERRLDKQARKDARKRAAADGSTWIGEPLDADGMPIDPDVAAHPDAAKPDAEQPRAEPLDAEPLAPTSPTD